MPRLNNMLNGRSTSLYEGRFEVENISYTFVGGEWVPTGRIFRVIEDGLLAVSTTYIWENDDWAPMLQTRFTYLEE